MFEFQTLFSPLLRVLAWTLFHRKWQLNNGTLRLWRGKGRSLWAVNGVGWWTWLHSWWIHLQAASINLLSTWFKCAIFWACVLVRSIGSTWINWHEENCLTWWVEKSTSGKQSALLLVGHVVHRPPRPFQMNYLAGSNGLLYTRARHFQASDTILISYKTLRPVMELELKVGIRLSNSKSCI